MRPPLDGGLKSNKIAHLFHKKKMKKCLSFLVESFWQKKRSIALKGKKSITGVLCVFVYVFSCYSLNYSKTSTLVLRLR